jgi:hypothetical protein
MFLKPYPILETEEYAHQFSSFLRDPGTIDYHIVYGVLRKNSTSGIFATYGGYLNISDTNGQLIFPRKKEKPQIYLIITTRLTPIVITANTIHHWEFEAGTPTVMYKMERIKDPQTNLIYWKTESVEQLPENKVIPYDSITIFARPKYFYVPTGITLTNERNNFVLPSVYVKKGIKILSNTLYVLNIKQFFGMVDPLFKRRDTSYSELIVP